ncbi:hypothetical protein scyTo_0025172, partial [Scyliorhinus torazame]|nr:hypothetical protein [Scyliorhinus torazame]
VGNAVPPPLAKAIGLEFKLCLVEKKKNTAEPIKAETMDTTD